MASNSEASPVTDQIRATEDNTYGSRLREVAPGEYAETVALADSSTNGGLFFSTDNEMMVTNRTSVLRAETNGAVFDATVWQQFDTGSATTSVGSGEYIASTGGTANSVAKLFTNPSARHYPGTTGRWTGVIRLGDNGTANNMRRWGFYDGQDGFYFAMIGTTFGVGYRSLTVDTFIPLASCNGITSNFNPGTDMVFMNQYDIIHGGLSCRWVVNGRTIHSIATKTLTAPMTSRLSLPMQIENINSGGLASNLSIATRGMSYSRYSAGDTIPLYSTFTTTQAGTVLKSVPSKLVAVVINAAPAAGSVLTFYDNTAASGTVIAAISVPTSQPITRLAYGIETTTGLALSTSTALNFTVIYE